MNKFIVAVLSIIACIFVIGAFLAVILSVMSAISYSEINLLYALFAVPLCAAGALLYRWLDKKI